MPDVSTNKNVIFVRQSSIEKGLPCLCREGIPRLFPMLPSRVCPLSSILPVRAACILRFFPSLLFFPSHTKTNSFPFEALLRILLFSKKEKITRRFACSVLCAAKLSIQKPTLFPSFKIEDFTLKKKWAALSLILKEGCAEHVSFLCFTKK